MTSSVLLLSDECHEETAIMSFHPYRSMVIAKLKALLLILASLESSLEVTRVIIKAQWQKKTTMHILGGNVKHSPLG